MELEHSNYTFNQQYTLQYTLITRKDEYIWKCLHFFWVDITFLESLLVKYQFVEAQVLFLKFSQNIYFNSRFLFIN